MRRIGRCLRKVPGWTLDVFTSREFWSIMMLIAMLAGIIYTINVFLEMGDALKGG